jgi:hypothetical protein
MTALVGGGSDRIEEADARCKYTGFWDDYAYGGRHNPHLAITPAKKQVRLDGEGAGEEDGTELAKTGDEVLRELSRMRGLMIPQSRWPIALSQFKAKWTEYKQALGLLDFTDLIETCYRDVYAAPWHPAVIFADEAQDLNRMQYGAHGSGQDGDVPRVLLVHALPAGRDST